MAKNSLFLYLACAGAAALAAGICAYGALGGGPSDEAVQAASRARLQSSRLLCGVAESIYRNEEEERAQALFKASRPYLEIRDHARAMSSRPDEPSLEPISFLAFDYFADNSDAFQIFRSQDGYPEGGDCAAIAGIPEGMRGDLAAYMRKDGLLPERFRCYTRDGKNFFGYLLDSAAGKHVTYLYLEKFGDDKRYQATASKEPDLAKSISSLVLPDSGSSRILAVFQGGKAVFSSRKVDLGEIASRLSRENRGFEGTFTIGGSGYDAAVACGESACALTAEATPEKRRPNVPLIAFGAVLGIAIITLLLVWNRRRSKDESTQAERIGGLIEEYGKQSLLSKEDAAAAAEKITTDGHALPAQVVVALSEAARAQGNAIDSKITAERDHFNEVLDGKYQEGVQASRCMLQKGLPPSASEMPSSRFLDIASFLLPSKTGCTDAYDIFRVDRDNIAVVMASGSKGNGESLTPLSGVLAVIRRCIMDEGMRPGETLGVVNRMLALRSHGGVEIKAFVMILSEFTGNCIVSAAGYKSPLQFGIDGVKNPECGSARALGENPEEVYGEHKNKLDFGETLLLCGGGMFSIHNQKKDECYDDERLRSVCASITQASSASDTLIALNKSVVGFSGTQQNDADLCAVCVKKTNNAKDREV